MIMRTVRTTRRIHKSQDKEEQNVDDPVSYEGQGRVENDKEDLNHFSDMREAEVIPDKVGWWTNHSLDSALQRSPMEEAFFAQDVKAWNMRISG